MDDSTPNEMTSLRTEKNSEMSKNYCETKSKWTQIICSSVANASILSTGMALGLPAVTIKTLTENERFTTEQISWFASINTLASPLGGILSATILDLFGRKKTLIVINVLSIISWGLLYFSSENNFDQMFWQIMLGRFIIGVNTGLSSSPAAIYSAEIAIPKLRGRLTCLTSLSIALGVLVIYILGYIFPNDWRLVSLISAILSCFTLLFVCFIPESPSWLVSRGYGDEARKALSRIRGIRAKDSTSYDSINAEIDQIQTQIMSRRTSSNVAPSIWKVLSTPEVYKPLMIINAFFAFQQFTGTFVIVVYATKFVESTSADVDIFFITVLIGVSRVIATCILAFFILDRFGRKPPTIFSGIGMAVSMIMLSMYSSYGDLLPYKDYLTILFLLSFIITSTFGFLTIPFTMLPELFPIHVRGITAGVTVSFAYLSSFIAIKMYPTMVAVLGSGAVFMMYGVISIAGTLFAYFILPETKGKTLQEIENLFKSRSEKLNDSESRL